MSVDSLAEGWAKALSVDRKHFTMFFERMMDGFAYHQIVVDETGKPVDYVFLEVNNAFERMTGLKKEKIIGKKVTEVLKGIENDPADWIGRYGKVALTCEPAQFENYAQALGRWYSVSAYCPEKGYFVALFEDITEHKKVENTLKESEERLNRSQEIAHLGSWELDLKEDKLLWSDEVYRIFGLKPQEFGATYEAFLASVHPDDRTTVDAAYSGSVREGKGGYALEHRVVRRNTGEIRVVHEKCTHVRDESGKVVKSLGMVHDITERKIAEEALKKINEELENRVDKRTQEVAKERQRLYNVLETLPSYVVLLDENYGVPFANKVFRETFGESKGRPCYEFLFYRDSPCPGCETFKVLKTKKPHRWEWTGPNGRDYDIYDFPFPEADGKTLILEMGVDITERRHNEAELEKYREHLEELVAERTRQLQESEQRWAVTLSSIGDALIATDTDGKITFMNGTAEELTGWTIKEAHAKPVTEVFNIINEATRKQVENPITKVLERGCVVGLANHTLLKRKNGVEIPIDDSGAPIRTHDGKTIGVVLVFRDITERKIAEAELEKRAALIDLTPNAIIVRKLDGTITFWSKGAEKIYGWTKEETLSKKTDELFQTRYSQPFPEILDELKKTKQWTGELTHKTKSSKEIVVQSWWLAEKTEHGEIKSILESNVDLTERKRNEMEIARLASFPTLNPSPIIEVDTSGKITYVNSATDLLLPELRIRGMGHPFLLGFKNIVKGFDDKSTNTLGREIKVEGRWYHQQLYLVPHTQNVRIYTTDINDLKKSEEARIKAQEKLEENAVLMEEYASQMEQLAEQRAQQLKDAERLAAIGQTASMVGHDIRNPLQAITGDMYLIEEEAKHINDNDSKEAILDSVGAVYANLTYINKIVSDLQDYTRPLRPTFQDADLSVIIQGTIVSVNVPKHIAVKIHVADNAKEIKTDPAYIRRALTNLFNNAIQAMPKDGKLTVEATKNKQATIITVEDTGVGIPKDAQEKLFTPLFTTKAKGQGLGLSVVKRLVEALGGTIVFRSEENNGTKFIINLPQKKIADEEKA